MQEVLKDNHILTIQSTTSPQSYVAQKLTCPTFSPARSRAFRGSPTSPWAAESSSGGTGSTSGWRATSSNDLGCGPITDRAARGRRVMNGMALDQQPQGIGVDPDEVLTVQQAASVLKVPPRKAS
jgi:hypothetical protein